MLARLFVSRTRTGPVEGNGRERRTGGGKERI